MENTNTQNYTQQNQQHNNILQQEEEEEKEEGQKNINQIENQQEQQNYQHYQADIIYEANLTRDQKSGIKYLNEYTIKQTIGRGSFAKVKLVERQFLDENNTPQTHNYALKVFHKLSLEGNRTCRQLTKDGEPEVITQLDLLYEEIDIYQYLDHPNICKVFQIIDDENCDKLYYVLEYCNIGQLCIWNEKQFKYERNEQLVQYLSKNYNIEINNIEQMAQLLCYQILLGIDYLHNVQNVVNRDIKPDNILIIEQSDKNILFQDVKIADFSTCKQLQEENQILFDCQGTPGTRAPQMQFSQEGYNPKASDIWSVGISIYCFMYQKLPWHGESELELDIAAKNKQIEYDNNYKYSQNSKQFIDLLCQKDENKRLNAQQAIKHPWLQEIDQQFNQYIQD